MSDEELIDGVYKLVMCIATGGSGQVWEVVEQASGRHLAMKLLKTDVPNFAENKSGLRHEANVLKSLEHPMIIKYENFSTNRDHTYMTMEHFRAANVKLQIKAGIESVHVRSRRLFESVCQALSHVHAKGWVHRDVKPDNVLMNKVGEIRLVDFSLSSKQVTGFSKLIGGGKLKAIQGTRTYIAPETINKLAPTFQTDIYSLGIFFFEVLTGKTPFQAPTPEELLRKHLRTEPPNASEFNKNVSAEMDRLIARMLKKKPADRHATVDEVLGELRRIKIFKEDVTEESLAKKAEAAQDTMTELTDIRLDSRADAKLRVMLEASPELARQFAADKEVKANKKKAADEHRQKQILKSSAPTKPAAGPVPGPQPMPMPPGFPTQGYAQYPQMPMAGPPGMMPGMPGYPNVMNIPNPSFPPQNPFGMPGIPGGMMPSMPPSFAPATPPMPQAMPPISPAPQLMPGSPAAASVVAVPAPAAPVSQPVTKPVATAPPTAPQVPAKPAPPVAPPEELEFMTELPDIL